MNNIFLFILFILVLLIVIGSFIYMLNRFLQAENDRRNFELKIEYSKNILPNQLEAYERMALFLERIKPSSLVRRVSPTNDLNSYEYALIETIQNEFEHNLAQQIYIYPKTWEIILSAKNATQLLIRNAAKSLDENFTIKRFQEEIIKQSINNTPTSSAILYLQKDIQKGF